MLHFHQNGAEAVDAKFAKLQHLDNELKPAMQKGLLYVHSTVPGYPGPPAGSTYRRTGTLGRSITTMGSASGPALSRVEGSGSKVIGYIGSSVKYAPYVIGRDTQARWMRYWWTLQDVVEKAKPGVIRILDDAVSKLTR